MQSIPLLSPSGGYSVLGHNEWYMRQDKLCVPRRTRFVLTMFQVYQNLLQGPSQHVSEWQDLRNIIACVLLI